MFKIRSFIWKRQVNSFQKPFRSNTNPSPFKWEISFITWSLQKKIQRMSVLTNCWLWSTVDFLVNSDQSQLNPINPNPILKVNLDPGVCYLFMMLQNPIWPFVCVFCPTHFVCPLLVIAPPKPAKYKAWASQVIIYTNQFNTSSSVSTWPIHGRICMVFKYTRTIIG